jgi:nucleoside-diphosphate-sugar epimerase
MSRTRREFVRLTAAGAGAWLASTMVGRAAAGEAPPAWMQVNVPKAKESLRLLILGGTGFLGPHVVDNARARGHVLTLFNRGKTNPGLFPDIETILGDRDGQLDGLKGRKWDGVVDTSGYVPRIVKMSADLLAPSVRQYVFISTISVFGQAPKPGADESHPVEQVPDPKSEDVSKYYGGLKALCEKTVAGSLPGRATVVRPGLIVGPLDTSDRFTYWPVRMARGGEVLAPGDGTDPVQFIDVRDLAAFVVRAIEDRATGTFNATGPAHVLTMRELLEACRVAPPAASPSPAAATAAAKLTWVDTEFLSKMEVSAWSDMPVWVPGTGESAGFARVDARRAIGAGLAFRPAADTARDTLAWWKTLPAERTAKPKAGISPEREAAVLDAWHKRSSTPASGKTG